jgi:hypothetical protein
MLWGRLCSLFALIDEGFKNGNRIIIPAYNGGLFDSSNYLHIAHTPQFDVKRWEIGDQYLAQAIDLLAYERERWDGVGTAMWTTQRWTSSTWAASTKACWSFSLASLKSQW